MIELETLSTIRGESSMYIEDEEPEKRAKLAKDVKDLLRKGHSVFLMIGGGLARRIKGYNPEKNEWVLQDKGRPKQVPSARRVKDERVSARGTKATSVAPMAGG